ncbi:MAG: DUF5752 family protein [Candidatus Kaelpia imicola]|nr:DUF5752 family protein [Candidatus Kaelpia imicola]
MSKFSFIGCIEIKELLGKRAGDELKLLEYIEEVSLDCIYYHTHSYFLRHYYLAGSYPNDFANWVAIQVRDRVLGEKLASVTPHGFKSLEDVRAELIEIIDRHLSSIEIIPRVVYGESFYFMKSRIIEIPIGVEVNNFEEFKGVLKTVDASSIYYHIFESRLRNKKGSSDFAIWLKDELGLNVLAEQIELLDCYMYSLEDLRSKLIDLCNQVEE